MSASCQTWTGASELQLPNREASNAYYDAIPEVVEKYCQEMTKITGREYHLFNYYGAEDAENIIILMCSASQVRLSGTSTST